MQSASSIKQIDIGGTAPTVIIRDFVADALAEALREAADRHFSAPSDDGPWALRRSSGGGSHLAADAAAVLPAALLGQFVGALESWATEAYGLAKIGRPRLTLHAGGHRSEPGRPVRPSRLRYEYSLTRDARQCTGGALIVDATPDAAPDFNRLAVFDSRLATGVAPVEGTADPMEARLALTGTIEESGPTARGALSAADAWSELETVLRRIFSAHQNAIECCEGLLVLRCAVEADGRVSGVHAILDLVTPPSGWDANWQTVRSEIQDKFGAARFPVSNGKTELTVPMAFGSPLPDDASAAHTSNPACNDILYDLAARRPQDAGFLRQVVDSALARGDLRIAADFGGRHATLTRGSAWFRSAETPLPLREDAQFLTLPKLRHDVEQIRRLRRNETVGSEFDEILSAYDRTLEEYQGRQENERIPLSAISEELVRTHYGRILHVRPTPRIAKGALSTSWNRQAAENTYLDHKLGILVIDDFLSAEALTSLRQFCLDSTIWFGNRYAQGRLGSLFLDGFNCPLLVQIAEELRAAFPRVIGERHPLAQMWGYRYSHKHRQAAPHADFAAVNVNFWIAPEDANLDPDSGGLVIYDMEAPPDWNFDDYNGNGRKIGEYIEVHRPKSIAIPHRENRALIFNSDLFHTTANCSFRDGFESTRTNVTMLYGSRNA